MWKIQNLKKRNEAKYIHWKPSVPRGYVHLTYEHVFDHNTLQSTKRPPSLCTTIRVCPHVCRSGSLSKTDGLGIPLAVHRARFECLQTQIDTIIITTITARVAVGF
jgi:hypothetical protein